ncbi:hypothetical protein [Allocoleopsis franciscana]|uniref:hypothetical protein n=1 Tax=Allocoleopsis franciscana TaxID=2886352 RepID=UPI00155A63DE|nr:hypothetical protein [Allocoleopsis franciscana]
MITFPQRAAQSFPVGSGLRKLFCTFSLLLVQGFCGILPDFLGAEQLSRPLKLFIAKGFRFLQQTLFMWMGRLEIIPVLVLFFSLVGYVSQGIYRQRRGKR